MIPCKRKMNLLICQPRQPRRRPTDCILFWAVKLKWRNSTCWSFDLRYWSSTLHLYQPLLRHLVLVIIITNSSLSIIFCFVFFNSRTTNWQFSFDFAQLNSQHTFTNCLVLKRCGITAFQLLLPVQPPFLKLVFNKFLPILKIENHWEYNQVTLESKPVNATEPEFLEIESRIDQTLGLAGQLERAASRLEQFALNSLISNPYRTERHTYLMSRNSDRTVRHRLVKDNLP